MTRVYITRQIVFSSIYDSRFMYEETVSSSMDKAVEAMSKIGFEDGDDFLFEIIEKTLDIVDEEEVERCWFYNNIGELLVHPDDAENDANVFRGSSKFEIGDYVTVRAFPWNKYSCVTQDVIGVVVEFETEDEDSKNTITIINNEGRLDHVHPDERAMVLLDSKLPEELQFLKFLKEEVIGKTRISDKTWKNIHMQRAIVKNVCIVDWDSKRKVISI